MHRRRPGLGRDAYTLSTTKDKLAYGLLSLQVLVAGSKVSVAFLQSAWLFGGSFGVD